MSPARRNAGRAVRAVLLVLAVAAGYYLISLYQVWSTGRSDQARPVDAIVVMGAAQYDGRPSPQLAARLDHVAELWPQGLAPMVVVTGGNQPGDRFTEAEASAAYLEERGVPADAIVQEGEGRTSYESLQGVARLLGERGLDSVLIVTDPFHSLRSRLIAQDAGLEALRLADDDQRRHRRPGRLPPPRRGRGRRRRPPLRLRPPLIPTRVFRAARVFGAGRPPPNTRRYTARSLLWGVV